MESGISSNRQDAYDETVGALTLSDIEGKNIGQCAERAAIVHQCLTVLNQCLLKSYKPFYTTTRLTVGDNHNGTPHAVVILQNNDNTADSLLFDAENPLIYRQTSQGQEVPGLGLYVLSPEELEQFGNGQTLKLKSIYEKFGMTVDGENRFYGDGTVDKTMKQDEQGENR